MTVRIGFVLLLALLGPGTVESPRAEDAREAVPPDSLIHARTESVAATSVGLPNASADTLSIFEVRGHRVAALRTGPAGTPASVRVALAEGRLAHLFQRSSGSLFPVEALRLEDRWVVMAGQAPVLEVTEPDARFAGMAEAELAALWAVNLEEALLAGSGREIRLRLFWKVALGLLLPALYVIILRLLYAGMNRLRRYLRRSTGALETVRAGWLRPFAHQAVGEWVARFILVVQILLFVVVTYLLALALFYLFPQTQGIAEAMKRTSLYGLKQAWKTVLSILPRLAAFVIFLVLLRIGFKVIDVIGVVASRGRIRERRIRRDQARILNVAAKTTLVMVGILLLAALLPAAEAHVLLALALIITAVGLVVLYHPMINLGLHILFEFAGPCEIGDRLRTRGRTGVVLSIEAFGLRILSRQGDVLFLPYREAMGGLEVFPRGTWSFNYRVRLRPPRPPQGEGIEAGSSEATPGRDATFDLLRKAIRTAWGKHGHETVLRFLGGQEGLREYRIVLRVKKRQALEFAREKAASLCANGAAGTEAAPDREEGRVKEEARGRDAARSGKEESRSVKDEGESSRSKKAAKTEDLAEKAFEEHRDSFYAREVFAELLLRALLNEGFVARLRVRD